MEPHLFGEHLPRRQLLLGLGLPPCEEWWAGPAALLSLELGKLPEVSRAPPPRREGVSVWGEPSAPLTRHALPPDGCRPRKGLWAHGGARKHESPLTGVCREADRACGSWRPSLTLHPCCQEPGLGGVLGPYWWLATDPAGSPDPQLGCRGLTGEEGSRPVPSLWQGMKGSLT